MNTEIERPAKWYQYPYVWLLVVIPLSAVIMGVIMFLLVLQSEDGLVIDDYYQQGKNINRVIARDETAAALGLEATLNIDSHNNKATLVIQHKQKTDLPASISLSFLHATRTGVDKDIAFLRTPTGIYQGYLPELVQGQWYLQLATKDWRLLGTWRPGAEMTVSLLPAELSAQ